LVAWLFVGIESVSMACDECDELRRYVPMGQILCMIALFLSSALVVFTSTFIPPGFELLDTLLVPLNPGTKDTVAFLRYFQFIAQVLCSL